MEPCATLSQVPATQDEFETWCATLDGSELGRFEFLYGCIVAEPPARWPHGQVDGSMAYRLGRHLEARGLGLVFGSSQGFALPSGDTVAPDTAVVLRQTWAAAPPPQPERFLNWLIDTRRRAITVLVRDADGRFGTEHTVVGDEPARSVLLAGFAVRPSEIIRSPDCGFTGRAPRRWAR